MNGIITPIRHLLRLADIAEPEYRYLTSGQTVRLTQFTFTSPPDMAPYWDGMRNRFNRRQPYFRFREVRMR